MAFITQAEMDASGYVPKGKQVVTVGMASSSKPSDFVCLGINDHVVINQAVQELLSRGGGELRIGAGSYTLGDAINLTGAQRVRLTGIGPATKIKRADGMSENMVRVFQASSCRVDHIDWDGNRANNPDPGNSQDATNNNIVVWQSNDIEIDHNFSHHATYHGIFVRDGGSSGSSRISIHHNTCYQNGYRAIHCHGNDNITIQHYSVDDNFAYENGQAPGANNENAGIFAVFGNCLYASMSRNIVVNELGYGIHAAGKYTAVGVGVPAERILICQNIVKGCVAAGMYVGNSIIKATVSDNISAGNGTSGAPKPGLRVANDLEAGTIAELLISGNQFVANTGAGVFFDNSQTTLAGIRLTSNLISDNSGRGVDVSVSAVTNMSINDNIIRNNTVQGIYFSTATQGTRRAIDIVGNILILNAAGAMRLERLNDFNVSRNRCADNTPSGGGAVVGINFVSCIGGSANDNTNINITRNSTQPGMLFDSACSDIDADCNTNSLSGTGVSIQGANIRVRRNKGTGPINFTASSSGCYANDNRNTATPYLVDSGTSNVVSRTTVAPVSATATGVKGDEAFDASGNHYRCTAANTWVRSAYATF